MPAPRDATPSRPTKNAVARIFFKKPQLALCLGSDIDFLLLSVRHSTACDLHIEFFSTRRVEHKLTVKSFRKFSPRSEKARTLQCPAGKGVTVLGNRTIFIANRIYLVGKTLH